MAGPIRPTISDVARAAGVSRTTVSHALNGIGKVDPRTRERVVQAAAELGYRPSLRAQRLRSGQSRTIGLVSSMPVAVAGGPSKLGFFMEVAAAAAETALLHGFALVLVPPLDSDPPLDSLDIDGAIVIEPDQDDPTTKRLQSRGVPIVSIGPQRGTELPHVDLRAPQVGRLLLEHLRERGAERIALLMGSGHRSWYVDLAEVYAEFAREHGMPPLVIEADESGGEDTGQAACEELLTQHPEVDAICASVDAFALGAVRAAASLGLDIPTDLQVATRYDGVRARTSTPTLTAVDLHLAHAASSAVELLLSNLKGTEVPQVVVNPAPLLVPRDSTRTGA